MTDSSRASRFAYLQSFSRARRLAAILAGGTAMAVSTMAWADPSAQDRETARSLMRDGRQLRDDGDLVQALARFQAANEIMHVPTTALEVAHTQVALGLLCEARNTLAEVRRIPSSADDPVPFQEARTAATALDEVLAKRIPSLTIVLSESGGKPSFLSIDGAPVPLAIVSLPSRVNPGRHVIVVGTTAGASKREVEVRDGENKIVRLSLLPNALGGTKPDLQLHAARPATAQAPRSDAVEGARSDGPEIESLPPEMSPPPSWTWTYVGIGVGSVALITGTITGAVAWSQESSLASECPYLRCGAGQPSEDLDRAKTWATVSTFAFVAAGAAGALVLGSVLLGRRSATSPASVSASASARRVAPRAVPWLGLGAAGVQGAF